MVERCLGQNRDGSPCSATVVPGRGYCQWHDPEREGERAEWRRKGGHARSNTARARKKLTGDLRDMVGVKASLCDAMEKVAAGEMEPAVGSALATLARAIVVVSGVADFEVQLATMRADIAAFTERQEVQR